MRRALLTTLIVTLLTTTLVACEKGNVEVMGRVDGSTTELVNGGAMTVSEELVLERAQVALTELEMEGGTEDDELEAEFGGAAIPLSLDGSPTQVITQEVGVGTYHTVGLELRQTRSITVKGTWRGEPFTFTSDLSPEVEFPIDPPATVTETGNATVAVQFDVGSWFVDADGNVLDPTDPGNQRAIDRNIIDSMTAQGGEIEWEDDD